MDQERLHPLTSYNFDADRLEQLQSILPEVFADGKINWDVLRAALDEHLEDNEPAAEHFGLFWAGKREARRRASQPSEGTLVVPVPGEGVNEATTRNIFIEADNLEALKLLQKSYAGRVKMIYIDPPYNTGSDFVYRDDFAEKREDYLRRTGQVGETLNPLTTNTKADGRFHSNWLNMMYSRLLLARTLLRDDGVIFVSIDDNEGHALRLLMNELFGDENHLVTLYIQVRYPDKTLVEDADFHKLIEQVLVFGKSPSAFLNKEDDEYSFDKFAWEIEEITPPSKVLELDGKRVEVYSSEQYVIHKRKPSSDLLKEIWATGKILDGNSSGRFFRDYLIGRYKEDGYGVLYKVSGIGNDQYPYRYFTGPKRIGATKGKYYQGVPVEVLNSQDEVRRSTPIPNFYNFADSFGNCRHEGATDFRSGKKPIAFIKKLLELATSKDSEDIILDFFAGSGSTGHAVFDKNREDEGNRQFILVQLPEKPNEDVGFESISMLSIERLRRSINQIAPDANLYQKLLIEGNDLGFKVFRYALSNYKPWEDYIGNSTGEIQQRFSAFEVPLVDGWREDDLLVEVILLQGFPLDSRIETLSGFSANTIRQITSDFHAHSLTVCLDKKMADATLNELTLASDDVFVCLDSALTDESKFRLRDRCTLRVI